MAGKNKYTRLLNKIGKMLETDNADDGTVQAVKAKLNEAEKALKRKKDTKK